MNLNKNEKKKSGEMSLKNVSKLMNLTRRANSNIYSLSAKNVFGGGDPLIKEMSIRGGKKVVNDIVDNIFDSQLGMITKSSSHCSSVHDFRDSVNMDKRLKHWQDTLNDRSEMELKIWRKTGKKPGEMLFNIPTTVEQRDKGTVNRLLDYAQRMKPMTLVAKQKAVLPEKFDNEQCLYINELQETLPKAEQDGSTFVEISGLPKITKEEIMGKAYDLHANQSKKKWLDSKVLVNRIAKNRDDIERVIEFYPDINNLEVVGSNPIKKMRKAFVSKDIECLQSVSLHTVTSSTVDICETERDTISSAETNESVKIEFGVMLNDEVFTLNEGRSSQLIEKTIQFECEPFHRQVKQVLRVENIGSRMINFMWMKPEGYRGFDDSFVFNRSNFTLSPGAVHICKVMFQPKSVFVRKQRWELKIFPNVFCNRRDGIILKLNGKCIPPPELIQKVNHLVNLVTNKSNKRAVDKLTTHHASLVPLIQSHEVLCPYIRIFDEREIFNAENPGYQCERYDDLESLKSLYKKLKKPREPQWNFRLDTMKKMILRLPEPIEREAEFTQLMELLETMKGASDSLPTVQFMPNAEQQRSRFIYVRGAIGNGIEEWEQSLLSMEQNALKLELSRFYNQLEENEETVISSEEEDNVMNAWLRQLKHENPELYVLRKLRANKFYMDSLYMQTYTHLCDMAENVVSVIESTEYV